MHAVSIVLRIQSVKWYCDNYVKNAKAKSVFVARKEETHSMLTTNSLTEKTNISVTVKCKICLGNTRYFRWIDFCCRSIRFLLNRN